MAGWPSAEMAPGHTLVEQPAQNHHGHVSRFAVGYAQAVYEAALDAHARQRRRKNLAAHRAPPAIRGPDARAARSVSQARRTASASSSNAPAILTTILIGILSSWHSLM